MEQTPSLPSYPTDLNDLEWAVVDEILGGPPKLGRPPRFARRAVLGAIFYMVRTGGSWRLLPHDLPPWRIVYYYFARWRSRRTSLKSSTMRCATPHGSRAEKKKAPTAAILDSQSVRTISPGRSARLRCGRRSVGRKRHLLVDTEGLILKGPTCTPRACKIATGPRWFLIRSTRLLAKLELIWADGSYAGDKLADAGWPRLLWGSALCRLEIVRRNDAQKGFHVLPRRWVVERTFGWLNNFRRLQQGLRVPHRLQRSLHLPRGFLPPHRTPRLALRLSVTPLRGEEGSQFHFEPS